MKIKVILNKIKLKKIKDKIMAEGSFKILVVGASGVGKTTFTNPFMKGGEDIRDIIGVDFLRHKLMINKEEYIFHFWVFFDDEKFEFVHKKYCKGANAAIFIFDLTKPKTLKYIKKYLNLIRTNAEIDGPFILIGNKIDLVKENKDIDRNKFIKFAKKEGITQYIETSIKDTEEFKKELDKIFQLLVGICSTITKKLLLKICLFGDKGVGKSSIVTNFVSKDPKSEIKKTESGVDFFKKDLDVDGKKITLQIWDISADDRFKSIRYYYMRGASGGIFMYDLTNDLSIKNMNKWIQEFRNVRGNIEVPILMVGNKTDLEKRAISNKEAMNLAKKHQLFSHIYSSANTGHNVDEIFASLSRRILRSMMFNSFSEVLDNEFYMKILLFLRIYKELSLSDLAKRINKSKATLSRYTRHLIDLGLIESYVKEDEPQAGTIKKNYYKLSEDLDYSTKKIDFSKFTLESMKSFEEIYEFYKKKSFTFKTINLLSRQLIKMVETSRLNLYGQFYETKPRGIQWVENIEELPFFFRLLTEKQYQEIKSLIQEFQSKLDEILKEKTSSNGHLEKTYMLATMLFPVLDMVDYFEKLGLEELDK